MKKIFKFSAMFFLVSVLFVMWGTANISAANPSGNIGKNTNWELDIGTGTLTISGGGNLYDFVYERYEQGGYWAPYKNSIKSVVKESATDDWKLQDILSRHSLPNLETICYELPNGFAWTKDCKSDITTLSGHGVYIYDDNYPGGERLDSFSTLVISDGITGLENHHISAANLILGKDFQKGISDIYVYETITVDPGNPYYAVYDNDLYTKDYKKFLKHYNQRPVNFHPGVQIIGDNAFPYDVEVVIPWGVTTLEGDLHRGRDGSVFILPDTLINFPETIDCGVYGRIRVSQKNTSLFKAANNAEYVYPNFYYSTYGITFNSLKTFANGKTYYFDQNYNMAKGWKQASGNWYYFNDYGAAVVKIWLKSGNKWYFMQADGTMATNKWIQWYNKWYYVGSDGAMYTNRWIKSSGKWYYLGSDGAMYTNRYTPDGCWVNGAGVWVK